MRTFCCEKCAGCVCVVKIDKTPKLCPVGRAPQWHAIKKTKAKRGENEA